MQVDRKNFLNGWVLRGLEGSTGGMIIFRLGLAIGRKPAFLAALLTLRHAAGCRDEDREELGERESEAFHDPCSQKLKKFAHASLELSNWLPHINAGPRNRV